MKTYDLIKLILTEKPETRSNDKKLMLEVWSRQNVIYRSNQQFAINTQLFITKAAPAESITRARRKIQELHKHLRAVASVEEKRREKQNQKGTFVYREETLF